MTYKINPIIERIQSPVGLLLPGSVQRSYESGSAACADSFERNLITGKIKAEGSTVVIEMVENQNPATNWTGEEQSFF